MTETKKIVDTGNPFLRRYSPNTRYTLGAFKEQTLINVRKDNFGESVVDKESYRLSLTTKRGSIGTGSSPVGRYMFQDGKYNPDSDFSYIMRKDLSIVQIDNYIANKEQELKKADESLKTQIQYEIEQAKAQREIIKEKENNQETSPND